MSSQLDMGALSMDAPAAPDALDAPTRQKLAGFIEEACGVHVDSDASEEARAEGDFEREAELQQASENERALSSRLLDSMASLAEKAGTLRLQLGLPDDRTLTETVDEAVTQLGLAKEVAGLPLLQKADACISTMMGLVPVAVAQQTMMVTVPAGVLPGGQFQAQTPSGMMMVTCPPTSNAGDQCVT